jgi:ectoine hydroxylase-related dioxygenase (phytanoyl-CoA dioxygenase family)
MPLNAEQIKQYERDGYTVYKQPVFPANDFARLKTLFEENLEKYGPDNLDVPHFRDARLLEFLLSDAVLDLVEPVVGPNIGLWSSHFICKPARTGKATPWHEDSSYWNGRVSTMAGICTVWLAIDPAFPENGSMAVIPETHQGGFSEYQPVEGGIFATEIKPELIDESKAVYFTLDPNECSLHEGRIIHGAKANTSEHRRTGYTMRYFPTTSKVYPEKNVGHKIWLARGIDQAGNTYENG